MEHDTSMRAAARAIYEAVYPSEDYAPIGFDQAERYGTVHYRQAVDAAIRARTFLTEDREAQPRLF